MLVRREETVTFVKLSQLPKVAAQMLVTCVPQSLLKDSEPALPCHRSPRYITSLLEMI